MSHPLRTSSAGAPSLRWFFDSWAVLDGLAFASYRHPETIDAETTVFLSVPDLEPIPIGRISTALRAQRSSFQDGFRDPETGAEFEFAGLDQIREVIRRAYLAGGLGPVPAPLEGPPPNPFRREPEGLPIIPSSASGGSHFDRTLSQLWAQPNLPSNFSDLNDPKARVKLLEQVHRSSTSLQPYLRAFAEATLFECIHSYADHLHLPEPREIIAGWSSILRALGFWDGPRWQSIAFPGMVRAILSGDDRPWHELRFDKEILFRVPCPLRSEWDRHIHTLGHKLLLPLVDGEYFKINFELPELIPSLFAAMVIAVTPELAVSRIPDLRVRDQHRLLGRACQWLSQELPQVGLPAKVEAELSKFAWTRLHLNPERPLEGPRVSGGVG
jgi:hypothetical protein